MPRRKKRIVPYGNLVPLDKLQQYLENWTLSFDEYDNTKIFSYLIEAEADSLIQIIISENKIYDGIYHLTEYDFLDRSKPELIVKKFDVIDSGTLKKYTDIIHELSDLKSKYLIKFRRKKEIKNNPFYIEKEFPFLAIG